MLHLFGKHAKKHTLRQAYIPSIVSPGVQTDHVFDKTPGFVPCVVPKLVPCCVEDVAPLRSTESELVYPSLQ